MKKKRQSVILQLIETYNISTQDELLDRLFKSGFEVTQATVSRDIKELRLVKAMGADGQYKYVATNENRRDANTRYQNIFIESVISANYAGNIVVLRCFPGMAQAACAAIDNMGFETIIGTLAGDDTIFVLCKSEGFASQIRDTFTGLLKK